MAQAASSDTTGSKRNTQDVGIVTGASRLTSEKIEKTINSVISNETGARFKTYVDICVRCGLCADACHFFLSHDRDPTFAPAAKVKQTHWEILKQKGRMTPEFIRLASEIAFTECNLCRRCVMYCPFGIDVAYMMLTMRRICYKLGVVPQYIQDTTHSHSATMNQMWVKEDEWIDSLMWQEEEARDEIPGLRIPLEKEGADILYSVIGPEPKFRAPLIYQAAVIMAAAGVDWTMPVTPGWDNSDMCMFNGDFEMMGRLKKVHFETALRLHVNRIVMGECGHAFRSVYDVGNRALGWKMPPLPIVHAIEFFFELLRDQKIKIAKKYPKAVTLHDPCNVVRGRGLHAIAREIVRQSCETFIEMEPNCEHNICCSAGGGVINCGPPFKNKRVEGNRVKAEQLAEAKAKGAQVIIAPCHNCHGGLEDIVHANELGLEIKFFGDILYECIEKPV